jgi:hypothetical protein
VDPVLARICDRALSVDLDERFASAKELRYALQNYMQLAGVRVESSEIGMLMQETFAVERRALHTRIEQAVHRSGMSDAAVDDLPIFQSGEKVPTAVADLSSLIQVSLEEDEQKLQKSYAHSKVTLVRPNGKRETVLAPTTPEFKSRNPLVWFMALSALVGVSLAVLTRSGTSKPKVDSQDSFATQTPEPMPAPVVQKLTLEIPPVQQDVSAVTNEPAPTRPSAKIAGSAAGETREGKPEASHRDSVAQSQGTPRARQQSAQARQAASESAPRESTRLRAAAPSNTGGHPEEGTDLTFGRRVPLVRIDSENPYQ